MLGVERLTYEVFYGLLLNKPLAVACQSLPVAHGIQVTLNGVPNLLLFDAESDCNGDDAGDIMNQAMSDLKMKEGLSKFNERFGGNGAR